VRPASFAALALLAGIVGCTPPKPPSPAPQAATETHRGVVVSVRPTEGPAAIRARILAAVDTQAPTPAAEGVVMEVIVRTSDGRTVSVIQEGGQALHRGDHVVVTQDAHLLLARAD
jgi:translation initiation factor IF-2